MKKVIRSDYVAERKISKQPKIETSESSQDQKENVKTENPEPVNGSEKSKKRSKWAAMAAERELWENEGFELPKPKISESKKPVFIKPDIKEMEMPKSTKPTSISGLYFSLYRHLVVKMYHSDPEPPRPRFNVKSSKQQVEDILRQRGNLPDAKE